MTVEEKIGDGNFGVVYKGRMGRRAVAIKEAKPKLNQTMVELSSEVLKEAVLSLRLRHENVVHIHGVCMEPLYIVMEVRHLYRNNTIG